MSGKACIITFGCQMNVADSEKMSGILAAEGYALVEAPEEADLVVVNTCSIRSKAEQKVFSLVGRLRSLKERRPGLILALTGCVAQHWGEKVLERAPALDVVVGTGRMALLPELVRAARVGGSPAVDVSEEWAGEHPAQPLRSDRYRAWVNIMYGCDNYCAYCVVPHVRGRERSREPDDIVSEVRGLAGRGVREVTLLGQNVNSYRSGAGGAADFPGLLRRIDGEAGIERIRFTTSHPKDFSRELIDAVADLPRVCKSVHLPLQAGGDAVLERMNRGYTYDEYRKIYLSLKERVPSAAVTTDIIVGFPGESEEDFERTLAALEELRFDAIFSFRFSPREGTAAWKMEDDVPGPEKTRRLMAVQELQKRISTEKNRELVGRTVEVLVEGPSRKDGTKMTGRTGGNKIVNFPGTAGLAGSLLSVRITAAGFVALAGEAVTEDACRL